MAFRPGIVLTLISCICGGCPAVADVTVPRADCDGGGESATAIEAEVLRVATLNIAHGRKDSANQVLLSEERVRGNLLELAQLLDRSGADAIALQEADAESSWSGNFDHVEFLLEHSGYRCSVHGIHASNRLYAYGTAVISPHTFQGSFAHSFKPSRPTTTKGFSIGALAWNPGGRLPEPVLVKIGSVHLDFSRQSVRLSQVAELERLLANIDGPLVLMGDFNTDWTAEGSSLRLLAERLNLEAFQPAAEGLGTYGDKNARLDWILVSRELEFRDYVVYPDIVSDHSAVAAELRLAEHYRGPNWYDSTQPE
jgi:endonuclease/exonuclease/phosphatase family metal-dependent hydrolase